MSIKTMSKKKQGAIAAIAGGALLLGTGGTFALWSDTAELIGPTTVTTGQLDVVGAGIQWDSPAGPIVPGGTMTGTVQIPVTLIGDGLTAELAVSGDEVTTSDARPAFYELDNSFSVTWFENTNEVGNGSSVTLNAEDFPSTGSENVTLTVKVVFNKIATPLDPTNSATQMDRTVDLGNLSVTLTQNAVTP